MRTCNVLSLAAVFAASAAFAATPDLVTQAPPVSIITVPSAEPQNNTFRPLGSPSYHFFNTPRSFGSGDLRGTGLNDFVFTPNYYDHQPQLPMQIWVN